MKKEYIEKLLSLGFNCIPIHMTPDNLELHKRPMIPWKKFQKETKIKDFTQIQYDYNGERLEITDYGLVTGFFDIECIDVDLKVILDFEERKVFKKELFSLLSDNVEDFYSKVVIKKTISGGYHIIYRAKNIQGNQKLANINGYKEAVIETRGVGGYICMYDEVIQERDYHNIQLISDEDREIIISCCKSFHDEKIPPREPIPKKTVQNYSGNEVTPWKDYNQRTRVWDLIRHEFSVVKDTPSKTHIRRNGASSPHSGYIFKDSGFLYLFSTGTQYPAEELLTPYSIYTIQSHYGDYTKSASELYQQGFGSRRKPKIKQNIINEKAKEIKAANIDFPIEILPKEIQMYIFESARTLNMSIDYMGAAFLWSTSLLIGNSCVFEIKRGWREICSLWISIVGKAGVGKSPSLSQITFPIEKLNNRKKRDYQKKKKEFDEYDALSKKEKESAIEVEEPVRDQFIVDDVTIEALINLHSQSKNGVGVFKDELAGWFKDMNKYKEGSDKEQWLSSWSGKGISVDRITRQSDYIDSPFLPVLGGIQPTILAGFFTSENRDNGFLDRMLFSFPNLEVEEYVDAEMDIEFINVYSDWILQFKSALESTAKLDEEGNPDPLVCRMNQDAKGEWIKIFNEITKKQNSDSIEEFLKSMLAKQKSYIPRFALILNIINSDRIEDPAIIEKRSIQDAYKLSKYFTENYHKLIIINTEVSETNKALKEAKGNNFEKLKAVYEQNPEFNRSEIAQKLNVSRQTIYRYIKQFKEEGVTGSNTM